MFPYFPGAVDDQYLGGDLEKLYYHFEKGAQDVVYWTRVVNLIPS